MRQASVAPAAAHFSTMTNHLHWCCCHDRFFGKIWNNQYIWGYAKPPKVLKCLLIYLTRSLGICW